MQLSARSFLRRCLTWLLPAIALAPFPASAQTATAEQVTAAVAKLEQLAEATVADGGVPALAIGVVHDDKIVFLKGFGVREAGRHNQIAATRAWLPQRQAVASHTGHVAEGAGACSCPQGRSSAAA